MTRAQQTVWIVGAIGGIMAILFAAFVILENKKEYEKRYPGCWQLIGENLECKANAAANRLMR